MLRGILRRQIRRDRPAVARLLARQGRRNSNSARSEDDDQISTAKDDLIAFCKRSLKKIHPEEELDEILQLEERSLMEEREIRERELLESTAKSKDLTAVEKSELIQGMSDWLERVVREASWVELALVQLEEPLNRLKDIEKLARQLELIPDELNLPDDTD